MSRLIRDDPSGEAYQIDAVTLPLSKSMVVTLLKACQSITAEYANEHFRVFLKELDDAMNAQIDNAKTNQEFQELNEIQRRFRHKFSDLERYFCGYLSEGFVKFKKKELFTTIDSEQDNNPLASLDNLELVSDDDLDETIAISSITQRAETFFAEPLWALNQRFAILNDGEHVTEANNPASPIQFCESLKKAIRLVAMSREIKTLVYRVFDDHLIRACKNITEDLNEYLKQQGILPYLKFSNPTGIAPKSTLNGGGDEFPDTHFEPVVNIPVQQSSTSRGEDISQEKQNELLRAIRSLQTQILFTNSNGIAVEQESIIDVLNALQARDAQAEDFSGAQGVIPGMSTEGGIGRGIGQGLGLGGASLGGFTDQLVEKLQEEEFDASLDQNSMQTIDLVGMVFQYMLDDENLPDRIKALLSHLHTPFLKIAFIDPSFFEQTEHPARVLLNSLADSGAQWVGNDGTSQYGIYERIKDIVENIVKNFDSDLKFITEILLEYRGYIKNIVRRQELMEKRATEKVQGEEKLKEVKLRVNEEIRARTQQAELPSAVLLFLLQPWSDYLSFALLRYGENSQRWSRALHVVDDLLWAIRPEHTEQEKQRQRELIEDLIASIESGLETIGYDQIKSKKLVDALVMLIKRAIQSKKAEPAPKPMRVKLEKIAAEKAGAEKEPESYVSPEVQRMVDSLKMIEFGTWFEFTSGKRLKVAWYNARTSHYMLVDQMGKRVDMVSGVDMAKQLISKEIKIISGSSKPFFERALENIYEQLNKKANETDAEGFDEES